MNELVSIIIPIYNSEKHLNRCLESILAQTYVDLEIILINDGSTDNSGDICEHYADIDSRIKYIDKKNEGQAITRNKGIDEANGRYLYFMDSDDYIDANFVENALCIMAAQKADCVIFNYYHIYDNNIPIKERDFSEGTYDLTKESDRYAFFVNVFLPYKCGFEVWNRIYDADIIRKNTLRFPIFKPVVGEDLCFNFQYFFYSRNIYVSNNRYYYYHHNEGSTMDLNKGNIQINRYNEISKIGYELLKKRNDQKYLKSNYAFMHILLVYHELMNYRMTQSKNCLLQIEDKTFFKKMIKINPFNIYCAIKAMGIARGIKYSLYGLYYKLVI